MKNPNASTHEEILCEKYFAMCKSPVYGIQDAAVGFYYDVFSDMSLYRVLNEKYGYTNKDFYEINVKTGLMSITTTAYNEFENIKKYVNTITSKIKSDKNAKMSRENRLREELKVLETYSAYCEKLLDEKVQISDDNWKEFSEASAGVAEMTNQRMLGNSFDRTYGEIMTDESGKADRKMSIGKCKQVCDDYVRTYRVVLKDNS
jgi:hypothetical protein